MNKNYQVPQCKVIPLEKVLMNTTSVEQDVIGGGGHGTPDNARQMNWEDDE